MSDLHELTAGEQRLSQRAAHVLGFAANVFRDGDWLCEPKYPRDNGVGSTPDEAIEDCRKNNATWG